MRTFPVRRVGAAGAVGFIILNIVAFAIAGSMPDYAASPTKIANYFVGHHKGMLVAVVLLGIGLVLLVAAIAQTADMIRSAGFPDAAMAFAVAGGALLTVIAIGTAILGAMTHMAKSGVPVETVRAFYQAAEFMLAVPSAWIGIFLALPLARLALGGLLPRWAGPFNGLLVLLLALGGISVKGSGVLGVSTGALPVLAHVAFLLLFVEIAVLLWRSAPAGPRLGQPVAAPV
jgi:hypothetical protein